MFFSTTLFENKNVLRLTIVKQELDGALVMLLRRQEQRCVAMVRLTVQLSFRVDQQRHDVDETTACGGVQRG